jgi:hypothetical protein
VEESENKRDRECGRELKRLGREYAPHDTGILKGLQASQFVNADSEGLAVLDFPSRDGTVGSGEGGG